MGSLIWLICKQLSIEFTAVEAIKVVAVQQKNLVDVKDTHYFLKCWVLTCNLCLYFIPFQIDALGKLSD